MHRRLADGGMRRRSRVNARGSGRCRDERSQPKSYKSGTHHQGCAEKPEHPKCKTQPSEIGVLKVVQICLISRAVWNESGESRWRTPGQ